MKVNKERKAGETNYNLFVSIFSCVLILLSAFFWFQDVLRDNINQTNYKIMHETAQQQLHSFEVRMQGQLSQLQLYARNLENVDMNDYKAVKELLNVTEGAGSFQTISVANTTGKLVNNHNTSAGNIMRKQYFQTALAGNAAIGIDVSAEKDGSLEFFYAVPIYQRETVIGVLVGSESQSKVAETVMTDSFGGTGATLIINKDGDILLQSRNEKNFIGDATNYLSFLGDANETVVQDLSNQMSNALTNDNLDVYRCKIRAAEYIIIRKQTSFNDWNLILQVDASVVDSQRTRIMIYVLVLLLAVLFGILVIVAALFKLQKKSDHLKNKAEHDLLTNLLNKNTFEYMMKETLSSHPENEAGALWIIDLDNFKGINDSMGHMVGDHVLSCMAEKMRETFRQQDHLGRIGGDEFAVYMTLQYQTDRKEQREIIQGKVECLNKMIGEIAEEMNLDIRISCSIGIALNPEHGTSYEKLYQNADHALYQSKKAGKDTYTIFSYGEGGRTE